MRSSSFSLFIISLFSLNSYFVADAIATTNHNLSKNAPPSGVSKKQSPQRLYRDFGLSPVLDANIVREKDISVNAPNTVEKPFHFPVSFGEYETDDDSVGTNAQDLGQYAGYYKLNNTNGARWFYYFFKNDRNAPVVVWLTGGPGCSSSLALFYENGPFKLTKNLSLFTNEYSWSTVSNIIYIDQPTGTGFSYTTDKADIRHTSEEAAVDFYNFMQLDKLNVHMLLMKNELKVGLKRLWELTRAFVSCSETVQDAMGGDSMKNFEVYVPGLLQDGIKVLIYAGEYDLICNWLGNAMWVEGMKWFGQRGFNSAMITTFRVDGENAGQYKSYKNLTFLKVKDAGHMVPMDQPKASLEMLRRWTKGIPL